MRMKNDTIEPSREPDVPPEQEESNNENLTGESVADQIYHSGSVTANGRHLIHCLTIIGQVEGHFILPPQNKTTKYEHVLPQLVAIDEAEDIKGLLILLNTVGGDVEAGLAIAEMVAGMRKPSVSLVIGGGHSIGVPLAVCARRSFIVPTATMTLHPVRVSGMVINAPQSVDYLKQMQERVVRFVCAHSGLQKEAFYRMLEAREDMANDVGTILDGEAAVRCGLIDQIGGVGDALDALRAML